MTEHEIEEHEMIVLTDDAGNEIECVILDYLEVDNKKYVVVAPMFEDAEETESEEDEMEVDILRIETDENGEEILSAIEDDEEWEKVADVWQEQEEE